MACSENKGKGGLVIVVVLYILLAIITMGSQRVNNTNIIY